METIVMQGGIWPKTLETAVEYSRHFNVIISTMEGQTGIITSEKNIKIIYSAMPENRGQGNMNLQIVSSFFGIKQADDEIVIKTRTDQKISLSALTDMINRFKKQQYTRKIDLYDVPCYPIFVLGNQSAFPFSSQDHLYIGWKQDLLHLFDIPLNKEPLTGTWSKDQWGSHQQADKGLDFNIQLRMPIYLGAMYYARFYPEVRHFIENWREYLTDNAPKRAEAMEFYNKVKDSLFKVLPKYPDQIWWEKMNCYYPYSMYEPQGEYYEKQD